MAGELRSDFHALMGKGFDARIMAFLDLDYDAFAEFVRTGATAAECAEYVQRKGRPLNEATTLASCSVNWLRPIAGCTAQLSLPPAMSGLYGIN